MRKHALTLFLLTVNQIVISQSVIPANFRSPLDIPLLLSGCFGELRTNHFHTGLDIKTQGATGLKVYAVEEGYISRIQKSLYGYGYVLYMNHPNGLTTVYAHLSKFHSKLEKYYFEEQYRQQGEYLNLDQLPDTLFRFKKGDIIGYSGNTGHSGGPHLHFEVRETQTEMALNPWLYKFPITDQIAPNLLHLKVYELSKDSSQIISHFSSKKYDLAGTGKEYQIKNNQKISVSDVSGFAIHTIDLTDGSGNQCGVYSVELFKNDTLIFKQEMRAIDFMFNRYINAHMDHIAYREHKNSYHKSFIFGNNKLNIYPEKINNGIVYLSAKQNAKMKYVVKDIKGNTSILNFEIINDGLVKASPPANCNSVFYWFTDNVFENETIKIKLAKESIYENICFSVQEEKKRSGMLSPVYYLMNYDVPVQNYFDISIRVDSIVEELQQKLVGIHINSKGGISAEGGICINGWLTFKTRNFGRYSVMIDTIPPLITPENISESSNLSAATEIRLAVADNLSGIKLYNAYINDQWVLMHYDPKKGKLKILFDEIKIKPGEHQLKIEVADERNNLRVFIAKFIR